jgi:hypothetical protein
MAGERVARAERVPLGRPGERPQGCGGQAKTGSRGTSRDNPRWTRAGVNLPAGWGRCQGNRWSTTSGRARRTCVYASTTRQVQRSACSGRRTRGRVHLSVGLRKRNVCSTAKRRTSARQARSKSGTAVSGGPCHHSQSACGSRVRWGRRLTSTSSSVPRTIGDRLGVVPAHRVWRARPGAWDAVVPTPARAPRRTARPRP